ncbi:ABC transporter transmembrane region [Dictyocaulus viviparus]|uniref:ABC transporter transmembrane region n=1 Tax=Dictyocaulus viviparus TaxID=29172 RepID=A0A0D8XRI0_DICVI|nr:ABC transporter transmembrane region [Dictyocaulus viviparus]
MILWKLLQQSARCGFNRKIFSSSFMRFWDRTSFIVWRSQPAPLSSLLKAGRLSSLLPEFLVLLMLAQCNSEICLTKRADHLNQEYLARSKCSLSLSDVWSLIRPHFYWFIAAVISAILVAVVNIGLPIYLGELIDRMVLLIKDQSKDVRSLNIIKPEALKLILCYSAQAVLTFFYITFLSILGERVASDLRLKLFNNLVLMDMSFHDAQKSAELSNRLNVDVQEFKSSFKLVLAQGIKTATQVTGCFFILVSISPKLTLYTVSALPLIIAIGTLFGALLRSLSRRAQAQFAVASCVADEAFSNIRTVRAFAMEEQESKIFKREVLKACSLQEMLGMGIGLFQAATNFFLNGIVLSVLYGGSSLITSGEITPGQLMSFLVTAQTIQKSMSQFSQLFGTAVKGWTAGARVFQFANMQPSICTYDGVCIPYHSLFGEVRFENVKFAYPARPEHCVFENLNLTIPAGHVVAFCGASGEGKTTITSLLERFYEPLAGRVLLDNHDLRTLNLDWLRGQVSSQYCIQKKKKHAFEFI